jgi:hypothetical protein
MNDETVSGGRSALQGDYSKLGQWLLQVLQEPAQETEATLPMENENDAPLELKFVGDYHIAFYQQLPDFIMALLKSDLQAPVRYAPLLFHLAACQECHLAYLDLYDAMHVAVQPRVARPSLGQGTRTLSATPHRMLSHLCQSLISQAEAILHQARHERLDQDEAARSLLQLALRVSAHIQQSTLRRQALQDLVRVATLFANFDVSPPADNDVYAYSPVMAGNSGTRRGVAVQHVDSNLRAHPADNAVIHLQAHALVGSVVQQGEMLELHLYNLEASLRGQFVTISILLGSLLEPVRWQGGNPWAIQSAVPVDEHGTLVMALGKTDLRLTQPEERNLLEAMFMLLEVRKRD